MSQGVDKLILLANTINTDFLHLAREHGDYRYGYRHVLDLSEMEHGLPILLYCDGLKTGIHKIEVLGVASLGLSRTCEVLKYVLDDLSRVHIHRVDFCTDILGLRVCDAAAIFSVPRVQNYYSRRTRGAFSYYLQNSEHKTIVIYDKARELRAKRNPWADMLRQEDELTRIEVRLKGPAVPFKKIHHLYRYGDIDLLAGVEFRQLTPTTRQTKPLHVLAASQLRDEIGSYGLQAVKKRFSSSEWAYINKLFLEHADPNRSPDIRGRLTTSVTDWLKDRIRFPRPFERSKRAHA